MTETFTELFDNEAVAHEGVQVPIWNVHPSHTVSLLNMLRFYAGPFHQATRALCSLQEWVRHECVTRGKDSKLTEAEFIDLRDKLKQIDDEYERIWLARALERLASLRNMFLKLDIITLKEENELTLERLGWELDGVSRAASLDLFESTFIYVPKSKRRYCDKPDLFGKLVLEKFPNAKDDIVEAGNCYAVGAHTACVFHLMRVLEHGLRSLAKKVHVPFPSKHDLLTWEALLKSIEDEVKKIIGMPKSNRRNKDLEFYNGAVAQFRFFKDAWRNHVMHTRASYDIHEASKVMEHVRDFMQHLATRLKGK